MVRAIGIDLGTTFSATAIVGDDGKAIVIPNNQGKFTTPSVALWHNDHFLVGQDALNLVQQTQGAERQHLSSSLIRGVKRMIGKPPEGGLLSNGHRTSPIEVSAAILAKLVDDASRYLHAPIHDAVITVPAHFVDQERSATKAAAEMAGLRVLQIINEPSAAALAYTHGQQAVPGVALVFDLGGGTFDATVLQLGQHEGRVLATKGIEELGGINFTNSLATLLQRRYQQETHIPYPNDGLASTILLETAETAKCKLSDVLSITVRLAPPNGPAAEIEVTRQQFEHQIDLLLLQLQIAVEQALDRAHKSVGEIDRILLCGGSSRIPAVQAMLHQLFGRHPEAILDLDLSVALGAAYQAASYQERLDPTTHAPGLQLIEQEGLVVDCVTYPVGIAVKNARGEDIKLIMLRPGDPLNTWSQPYPVRILSTANTFPPLEIYSGESTQLQTQDRLGSILVKLPPHTPAGASATVMMRQNQSGIVEVQININGQDLQGNVQRVNN